MAREGHLSPPSPPKAERETDGVAGSGSGGEVQIAVGASVYGWQDLGKGRGVIGVEAWEGLWWKAAAVGAERFVRKTTEAQGCDLKRTGAGQ